MLLFFSWHYAILLCMDYSQILYSCTVSNFLARHVGLIYFQLKVCCRTYNWWYFWYGYLIFMHPDKVGQPSSLKVPIHGAWSHLTILLYFFKKDWYKVTNHRWLFITPSMSLWIPPAAAARSGELVFLQTLEKYFWLSSWWWIWWACFQSAFKILSSVIHCL